MNFLNNSLKVRDVGLGKEAWLAITNATKKLEERKLKNEVSGPPEGTSNLPANPEEIEVKISGQKRRKDTTEENQLEGEELPQKKKAKKNKNLTKNGSISNKKPEENFEIEVQDAGNEQPEKFEIEVRDLPPQNTENGENSIGFKWKSAIKRLLTGSPENQMKVKKLRKRVVKEYKEFAGSSCEAEGPEGDNVDHQKDTDSTSVFMKKLASMKKVVVQGKVAKYQA